jgi:hypothetical protein
MKERSDWENATGSSSLRGKAEEKGDSHVLELR